MRNAIRGGALGKGDGQLAALALAGQPARLGHMGIVAETPGVVAIALGDEILGGLGLAVLAGRPLRRRLYLSGVEVVPLEVQAEGGVGGNGDIQRNAGVDGQHFCSSRSVAGSEGLVDVLGENVAFDIGIGVSVVQAGVAGRVQHGGVVRIVIFDIGVAHGRVALHDGAGHADMVLLSSEIGVVGLFAVGIEGVALEIDLVAAACAAVYVLVGGQVQRHTAQRHGVVAVSVLGKGTVGIASGRQLGVEHLIFGAVQLAHGGVILLLALRQGIGEVAVQEHVLELVAQHLVAVGVLGDVIQLDDGIAAGVVLAHEEAELHGGVILHGQGQRPGIGGEVLAVEGGIEAVDIRARHSLGELDQGAAEESLLELLPGAPALAVVGGALIIVVLVGEALAVKDLARLQVAEQIGGAGLDGGAGGGGHAVLQLGNSHSGWRDLALGGHRLGVRVAVGGSGGLVALIRVGGGGLALVGGDGGGGLVIAVGCDDSGGNFLRERRHGQVAHQGQHHGQRQQQRKQPFACFHVFLVPFYDFSLYKAFRQKALRGKLPPKSSSPT